MINISNPNAHDCECKWLEEAAKGDLIAVMFDEQSNQYHFIHEGDRGYSMIYYCPFCGGNAPKSISDTFWTEPTTEEIYRLDLLTREFKTIEDIFDAWGKPDSDHEIGGGSVSAGSETEPSVHRVGGRRVVYCGLSETADVHVSISRYGELKFSYQGRYIGPKSS